MYTHEAAFLCPTFVEKLPAAEGGDQRKYDFTTTAGKFSAYETTRLPNSTEEWETVPELITVYVQCDAAALADFRVKYTELWSQELEVV